MRYDHAQLVHAMWLQLAELKVDVHIVRVSSRDNIADLPSRGEYTFLEYINAVRVERKLDTLYEKEPTWAVLQNRWNLL